MKRKGFTLIELLAVIVILAIIALIATPLILNVVEESKKKAKESSAHGYLEALEQYQITSQLEGKTQIPDGTITINDLKNYSISVKGEQPVEGYVTISKGGVSDYKLQYDGYYVSYNQETKSGEATKGEIGTEYVAYNIGDQITIGTEKFYVIEESSKYDSKVTAIAAYNLKVGDVCTAYNKCEAIDPSSEGYGLQSSEMILAYNSSSDGYPVYPAYGMLAFSSTLTSGEFSDYVDINIQDYDGPTKNALNNYISLLNSTYNINITGSLITQGQVESLKEDCEEGHVCFKSFVSVGTFWTGFLWPDGLPAYLLKTNNAEYYYFRGLTSTAKHSVGIRPVITISKSDLKKLS